MDVAGKEKGELTLPEQAASRAHNKQADDQRNQETNPHHVGDSNGICPAWSDILFTKNTAVR